MVAALSGGLGSPAGGRRADHSTGVGATLHKLSRHAPCGPADGSPDGSAEGGAEGTVSSRGPPSGWPSEALRECGGAYVIGSVTMDDDERSVGSMMPDERSLYVDLALAPYERCAVVDTDGWLDWLRTCPGPRCACGGTYRCAWAPAAAARAGTAACGTVLWSAGASERDSGRGVAKGSVGAAARAVSGSNVCCGSGGRNG